MTTLIQRQEVCIARMREPRTSERRAITGIEGRIDLGKLRICWIIATSASPLIPAVRVWRI